MPGSQESQPDLASIPAAMEAYVVCDARTQDLTVGFVSKEFWKLHRQTPIDNVDDEKLETLLKNQVKPASFRAFRSNVLARKFMKGTTSSEPATVTFGQGRSEGYVQYYGVSLTHSRSGWPYLVVFAKDVSAEVADRLLDPKMAAGVDGSKDIASLLSNERMMSHLEGLAVSMWARRQRASTDVEKPGKIKIKDLDARSICSRSTSVSISGSASNSHKELPPFPPSEAAADAVNDSSGGSAQFQSCISEERPTEPDSASPPESAGQEAGHRSNSSGGGSSSDEDDKVLKVDDDCMFMDLLEDCYAYSDDEVDDPEALRLHFESSRRSFLFPCTSKWPSPQPSQDTSKLDDPYFVVAPFLTGAPCILCTVALADIFGLSPWDMVGVPLDERFFGVVSREPLAREAKEALACMLHCAEKGVVFPSRVVIDGGSEGGEKTKGEAAAALTNGELIICHKFVNRHGDPVRALMFLKTAEIEEVSYTFGTVTVFGSNTGFKEEVPKTLSQTFALIADQRKRFESHVAATFWYSAPPSRQGVESSADTSGSDSF